MKFWDIFALAATLFGALNASGVKFGQMGDILSKIIQALGQYKGGQPVDVYTYFGNEHVKITIASASGSAGAPPIPRPPGA